MVIVKASHTGGLKGLKGLNYCHPGLYYDHAERWTERFLKHFERIVTTPDCEKASSESLSPAEIEVSALADFFGSGCRPGAWSNDPTEDQKLSKPFLLSTYSKGNPFLMSGSHYIFQNLPSFFDFIFQNPNIRNSVNCAHQKPVHVHMQTPIVILRRYNV